MSKQKFKGDILTERKVINSILRFHTLASLKTLNMKKIIFALLFAAYVIFTMSSCYTQRNGCPATNSQGRVPGKFRS